MLCKPDRLRHIRWIGGGTAAGKTTIARRLAARHGLWLYECDPMQSAHTARSNRVDHPLLFRFIDMSMDKRWARRTPLEMYETWPAVHGEGFHLIVEDLLDPPTDRRCWWRATSSCPGSSSHCLPRPVRPSG